MIQRLFTLHIVILLGLAVNLMVGFSAHRLAHAGTIVVNTPLDVIEDDGLCSFGEAIDAANTDSPSGNMDGECSAGSEDDIIDLTDVGGPVIELISGFNNFVFVHQIASNMTFQGPGSELLEINGLDDSFPFLIDGSVNVTIADLAIVDGRNLAAGGALFNDNGHITLERVRFTGNRGREAGGAIWNNSGTILIRNCKFDFNSATSDGIGAALFNLDGTVLISESTFISNSVMDGTVSGTIANLGTTIIEDSTISDNGVSGIVNGGRLMVKDTEITNNHGGNPANAGGINNFGGTVQLGNGAKITGNMGFFGGGIHNEGGTMTLSRGVQIGNNDAFLGGGIFNDSGTVSLEHGVQVIDNTSFDGGGVFNRDGTVVIDGGVQIKRNSPNNCIDAGTGSGCSQPTS